MRIVQHAVIAFLLIAVSSAWALETGNYYAGARMGLSMTRFNEGNWSLDPGSDITDNYNREGDDNLAGLGLFVGRSFTKHLRVEAEYYTATTFDHNISSTNDGLTSATMELDSHRLLALGYFDFVNQHKLTPFVCIGAGIIRHETDYRETRSDGREYAGNQHNSRFAWTLGTGVNYPITKRLDLEVIYRFVSLGSPEWKGLRAGGSDFVLARSDMDAQELLVGVRFAF
jgi:opacity protein-like surface antigen